MIYPGCWILGLDRKALEDKGIYLSGFIKDINKAIASKQIFISPTIMGSGVRLKILHAFSLNMPVICTSLDAKSLPYLKHEEKGNKSSCLYTFISFDSNSISNFNLYMGKRICKCNQKKDKRI